MAKRQRLCESSQGPNTILGLEDENHWNEGSEPRLHFSLYHNTNIHIQSWLLLRTPCTFTVRINIHRLGFFLTSDGVWLSPGMMRLLLSHKHILLFNVTAVLVLGSSPVAVNWSTKSYGPDGPWQVTLSLSIELPRMSTDTDRRQSLSQWVPTRPATLFRPSTCILEDYMDQ